MRTYKVDLPQDVHQALHRFADAAGMSDRSFITQALIEALIAIDHEQMEYWRIRKQTLHITGSRRPRQPKPAIDKVGK